MNEANTMADITGDDHDGSIFPVDPLAPKPAETIDQAHERLGHTAPRVTPADLEANIASEHFFTALDGATAPAGYFPTDTHATKGDVEVPRVVQALGLLTFCVLVLRNGFTVIGTSACASPENFNAELGRKIARTDAVRQVWPLMGYALRERLHVVDQLSRGLVAAAHSGQLESHENGDGR